MKKRINYFDSLRLISIFIVFTTHYIASFCPALFYYWSNTPTKIILGGVTGKFAVSMFSVILGFFACQAGERKGSCMKYIISRYAYFVICGFIINILFVTVGKFLGMSTITPTISLIFRESFLLNDAIFPTFWCIRYFFLGSIICFINTRFNLSIFIIFLEIIILIILGDIWISICLLGNIYKHLCENQFIQTLLSHYSIQATLFTVGYILFNQPESTVTYFIDGLFSLCILLIIKNNFVLQNKLNNTILAKAGQNSMALFLIHTLGYTFVGKILFHNQLSNSTILLNIIAYFISLSLVIILSFPLTLLLNQFNKCIRKLLSLHSTVKA